ncbi:MAG: GNAT family N-acetyltransferase [Ferruginibacter sp.]
MNNDHVQYRILTGFDDISADEQTWNALLAKSPVNFIFMTRQWQRTWWEVYGRGKLLIVVAEQNGEAIAIAPLFADGDMIFFIGSGGSDYLDFIGDISGPGVLENMLRSAREQVAGFLGFRFYHIRKDSATWTALFTTTADLGQVFDEGDLPAPMMEIEKFPAHAAEATNKKSLLRHEGWFIKNGGFVFEHSTETKDILQHLPSFFEQHIKRWEPTPYPSLFSDPKHVLFYQRICAVLGSTGWLRFTRIIWQGEAVAYHFGFSYAGSFLWYKPSFDITLAKRSPGEVLIRQLLLWAISENLSIFDFGLGDEDFKKRFATADVSVSTVGLYPDSVIKEKKA